MSGFTLGLTVLAFLSLVISLLAVKIAKESDRKMKAIADSQIDEKLAKFAEHLSDTNATLKHIKCPYPRVVWTLNEIRMLNSDLNAASDLKDYASVEKKKALITKYIIPILKNLYSMKKRYQRDLNSLGNHDLIRYYPDYRISLDEWEEWNDILMDEITKTALSYGIETETIRNIIND